MSKNTVKSEKERTADSKGDSAVSYEKRQESSKGIWETIFSCKERQQDDGCKKVRFKWVC